MTEPVEDPDLTTRARGESPDGARRVLLAVPPMSKRCRVKSSESMTGPVPDDPDQELTHTRGESPWTTRAFVGLTDPAEPMTEPRGETPQWSSMLAALRASEPGWPQPIETRGRGEDPRGALSTVPGPRPHPGPSRKRTNGRGGSPSVWSEPLEPRTANRGESPAGFLGSARRPGPSPRPGPNPSRTFDRGEAAFVSVGGQRRVAVDEPMTLLGLLAARQAGRG